MQMDFTEEESNVLRCALDGFLRQLKAPIDNLTAQMAIDLFNRLLPQQGEITVTRIVKGVNDD